MIFVFLFSQKCQRTAYGVELRPHPVGLCCTALIGRPGTDKGAAAEAHSTLGGRQRSWTAVEGVGEPGRTKDNLPMENQRTATSS